MTKVKKEDIEKVLGFKMDGVVFNDFSNDLKTEPKADHTSSKMLRDILEALRLIRDNNFNGEKAQFDSDIFNIWRSFNNICQKIDVLECRVREYEDKKKEDKDE